MGRAQGTGGLSLALLGAPEARREGGPVLFPTRKTLALLAYLAAEPEARARTALAALFWPESDTERAQAALRRTLARLKRAIGGADLEVGRDRLRFVPAAGTEVDLDCVGAAWEIARSARPLAAAQADLLRRAVALARGPFLEGLSLPDAPEFDDWASLQRETWHRRVGAVLERLSAWQADAGDAAGALDRTLRWVAHDPYDEAARRRLIELHLAAGERGAALAAFESYRRLLADELGAAPDPATVALVERLRSPGGPARPAPERVAPAEGDGRLPLVGRADEHRRLATALRAVEPGAPSVVALEGEAGIGKSRLADAFLGWAAARAEVVWGRAIEAGGPLPYQPIVEGLRRRLAREEDHRALLPEVWLAELSRILPELSERLPGLRPPKARPLPEASVRLFEAAARLGAALAAGRPLLLAVDDLHWADGSSLDLLRYCLRAWAERRSPVLLLVTLRPEELRPGSRLNAWLEGAARECPLTRLALGPIGIEDTRRLLVAAWGDPSAGPPEGLAERLFEATRGHPLLLVETLRHLREGGEDATAAPGVRAVVRARLERLGGAERRALAGAAVLGDWFELDTLVAVAGLAEEEAVGALEELLARRLLRAEDGRYAFSHDQVRQVVYDETSEPRRRTLHCRAVAALDAHGAPAAERLRHARLGGMRTRAFQLALEAGEEALDVLAARGAVGFFELARSLAASDPTAAPRDLERLYTRLGRAYELSDRFGDAGATYREMLDRALRLGDRAVECAALSLLGGLSLRAGDDPAAALARIAEAQRLAEAIGAGEILAETHLRLGEVATYALDFAAAKEHLARALEAARRLGLHDVIAQSLGAASYPALQEGRWDDVIAQAEEARAIYAADGNRALETDALAQIAGAHLGAGRHERGVAAARRAAEIAGQIENSWGQANAAKELALGLVERGDYAEALAVAAEGVAAARRAGFPPLVVMNLTQLGAAKRCLFDLPGAVEAHAEALEIALASPAPLIRAMLGELAAGELCADRWLLGDWPGAAEAARLALARRRPEHYQFTLSRPYQTRALVRAGEPERAAADVAELRAAIRSDRRYRITYLRAAAALSTDSPAAARAHLEKARALAAELDLPTELWQIDLELAEAARRSGDPAGAHDRLLGAEEIMRALADRIAGAAAQRRFLSGVEAFLVTTPRAAEPG
jgi:DNA-binding SARP family transcriptional activator